MPRLPLPSYSRQQALSLLVLALLPLGLFGAIALDRAAVAVADDARGRVSRAAGSVRAILARSQADLAASATTYATWTVLAEDVAALNTPAIDTNIIDFLVAQGTVDALVLVVGDRDVALGDSAADRALGGMVRSIRQQLLGNEVVATTFLDLGDGLYEVALARIDLTGRTGPGVDLGAREGATIAFGRRLDSPTLLDARQLTGFDLALFDSTSRLLIATDPVAARELGPLTALPDNALVRERGELVGTGVPIAGPGGVPVGSILVSAQSNVLTAVSDVLIPVLATSLLVTLVGAALAAVLLGGRLRRRLHQLELGLEAVATGAPAAPLPVGSGDELDRLSASHNRLAATLERRDQTLHASLDAITSLIPERGWRELAEAGVAVTCEVFGLEWCVLVESDGTVIAAVPATDPSGAPTVRATVPAGTGSLELVGRAVSPGEWLGADEALFALFARQFGNTLRDAELLERSAGRAERLDRLARRQADFLRGVSHNLQTPLTNIKLAAEDLTLSPGLDGDGRAHVDTIRSQADRLARLVNQLLTLSRLEAGTLRVESDAFALGPVVQRTWAACASDREFVLDDQSQGALAVADRAAVEQVVWMLLDNALRYAPEGRITVRIGVAEWDPREHATTRRDAGGGATEGGGHDGRCELRMTVEDEGPGVPAAERTAVFRLFVRGSTSRGHHGTGLGLGVARGLARAMGGHLRYRPRRRGAAFELGLPGELPIQPT